ncbi:MAG TPA: sialidase family protein [Thermoanaerobaculia bacterium]|jgi:hypothetical protein
MKSQRLCIIVALGFALVASAAWAATPASGTVSTTSSASWQGKTFPVSNPTSLVTGIVGEGNIDCGNGISYTADPSCDIYQLTVAPPLSGLYLVEIGIQAAGAADDFDLYIYDANSNLVGIAATGSGNERVALSQLPAGTYQVVVGAWLVDVNSTYSASARINTNVTQEDVARTYYATPVGPDFQGTPRNVSAGNKGQALKVQASYVGREAAEPTVGVNKAGTAFFVAGAFDAIPEPSPTSTARSVVLRSRDNGQSWQPIQPNLPALTTEFPTNLDPFLIVDGETGRLFSIDLYVACAYLLSSDDEGATWRRNPLTCGGNIVNDHQKVVVGNPPPNLTTVGYPNVIYYCFNRVADSSCSRSLDGGLTFLATGAPAYLGVDGGACGGLHGEPATDSAGRLFVPKGHCGFPWVSISENGGDSWNRVQVSTIPTADTEVNVAVDAADNVYVTWFDDANRLPYVAVSRDHGRTWGTPLMVAPPGVLETNFPAITAGDAGRIALTFPGNPTQSLGDLRRPWNSYVVVSTNALDARPLFTWTTANNPADPIHRGNCGPGRCGNMFDFLDINVSPRDGGLWATAVDTCMGACVSGAGESDAMEGVAIRQTSGPSLWAKRKRN